MHKAVELQHVLDDSGARVLVTSDQGYGVVEPIRARSPLEVVVVTAYRDFLPERPTLQPPPSFLEPPRACSDTEDFRTVLGSSPPLATPERRALADTALLQYTSATTGVPKGAELTHGTLIATTNVAIVNSPTTRGYDRASLRLCLSGGAPVPAEIARRWEAITGHTLVEGYGLTETTAPTHCNPPHRPRYGTVGLPFPFTDVKVVSLEDGVTELPVGASGEIVVRGPMVMKGYWRRPDATAEALRGGWFYTGDIGHVDAEGYFTIDERKKDMIKASGYSVFPAEV